MSDTHEHPHDERGRDHEHSHGGRSLTVIEEPLDPGNQSLADALRASFRILKFIMIVVVVLFLLSGFFIVDQNEVVVLLRLGRLEGEPRKPGLQVALPYPIDTKIRVPADTRTLEINSFWLTLSKEDQTKPLSQLVSGKTSLEPVVDGALLTPVAPRAGAATNEASGGQELVHVQWTLAYRIIDPLAYVRNVADEKATVRAAFEAASVARATRFTTDEIAFINQSEFRIAVQEDAQRRLDEIHSGIRLDKVNSRPYQPLQVRDEFNAVIAAQNRRATTIQSAKQEAEKILAETAGEAHKQIAEAIREFEAARAAGADAAERARREAAVDALLLSGKSGKATDIVKTAEARRNQIVQELRADADTLTELKPKYEQSPVLLPVRMWQNTKREIYEQRGVMRFFLPSDLQKLVLWLNRDPEQERKRMQEELKAPKK